MSAPTAVCMADACGLSASGFDGWASLNRMPRWSVPLVMAGVIAAAYANSLDVPFAFDDWHAIEQNPAIRDLVNLPRFFTDPTTFSVLRENRDLRPLLVLSLALNYQVSGLAPWSYHLVNLVLHWIVCLLVFRIVRDHLWLGPSEAVPVAVTAALLVAVHPLNTEAVNYISSRSALLTTACYLGAFDAAVRRRWGLACFLAAAAMLMEKRPPSSTRLRVSRPRWSVPNQCSGPGGASRSARFCASGA